MISFYLCLPAEQGPVATLQMGVLGALVGGCGVASASLWYFSRRYLGEVSLSAAHPGRAKFSVLDFWGNREVHIPYSCHLCRHRVSSQAQDTPVGFLKFNAVVLAM